MGNISYALIERQTNHALAGLRALRGLARRTTDPKHLIEALGFKGQFPSRIDVVHSGEYKYMRRTEATTTYLRFSGIPQTSAQIDAALRKGKVKSLAADSLKAQYSTMHYGAETGRFRRYGTRHWMLGD